MRSWKPVRLVALALVLCNAMSVTVMAGCGGGSSASGPRMGIFKRLFGGRRAAQMAACESGYSQTYSESASCYSGGYTQASYQSYTSISPTNAVPPAGYPYYAVPGQTVITTQSPLIVPSKQQPTPQATVPSKQTPAPPPPSVPAKSPVSLVPDTGGFDSSMNLLPASIELTSFEHAPPAEPQVDYKLWEDRPSTQVLVAKLY